MDFVGVNPDCGLQDCRELSAYFCMAQQVKGPYVSLYLGIHYRLFPEFFDEEFREEPM